MQRGVELGRTWLVTELAAEFGGEFDPDARDRRVSRLVAPEHGGAEDDLILVTRPLAAALARALPGVVLCLPGLARRLPPGRRWVHPHAMWVLATLLSRTCPGIVPGVAEGAVVQAGAHVDSTAEVRRGAVVLSGAVVGPGAVIGEGAVVYGGVQLGARVVVGPNSVLGRPGFGFAEGPGGQSIRIPHLGGVVIEDDVELGALVTVDAGTLGPTRIGRGSKLDAHVHVGHNVGIGSGTFVAAQAGFAGSVRLGRGVLVGGQVGVADHVVVGEGARLAARSGVIGDVAAGVAVAGYPAVPRREWLRMWARLIRQDAMRRRPARTGDAKKGST